jgi:hypothetical protein
VPISGIHRGVINALHYAKSISPDGIKAVYVDSDEEARGRLRRKWEQWGSGVELVVLPSPYRELTRPLLRYVDRLRRRGDENFVTVVLPEFVPARWWRQLLHNQSSLLLKGSLLFKKGSSSPANRTTSNTDPAASDADMVTMDFHATEV